MYTIFAFWKLNDTLYSIPAFRNCGNCSYTTAQQDMIIFYSGTCAIFMQVLLLQAIILTWVWRVRKMLLLQLKTRVDSNPYVVLSYIVMSYVSSDDQYIV